MATPSPATDPKPRRRFPLILIGGLLAVVLGGGVGWMLISGDRGGPASPPASEGGLVIDSSSTDEGKIDPGKPLRCFVQGQFVGELSLTDCAKRNGVATDALDVGVDESGALAAADQAGEVLTPLPPEEGGEPAANAAGPVSEPEQTPAAAEAPGAICWRRDGGRWRKLPGEMGLDACVHALYGGRCEKAGGATYGRWSQQTLRLVTGRVEISDDNRTFRTLVPQSPDCSLPSVG